jgi:hypothetical protein
MTVDIGWPAITYFLYFVFLIRCFEEYIVETFRKKRSTRRTVKKKRSTKCIFEVYFWKKTVAGIL